MVLMSCNKQNSETKILRSRIKENFSQETLDNIKYIMSYPEISNNVKFNKILEIVVPLGFVELAAGTNRMAVMKNDYVYKIALDSYGVKDNWNEFKMGKQLQPWVVKTYECNGLIAVSEYVNLMTQREFENSKHIIRDILEILSKDYIFEDIGLIPKNFCNFGFREDNSIVILDYGYVYPIDDLIMFCNKCNGRIKYNSTYSELVCSKCGKKYKVFDIKSKMDKDNALFGHNVEDKIVVDI